MVNSSNFISYKAYRSARPSGYDKEYKITNFEQIKDLKMNRLQVLICNYLLVNDLIWYFFYFSFSLTWLILFCE